MLARFLKPIRLLLCYLALSLSLSDLQTWSPGWHFLILSADKNRSDGKLSSAQEHVQEMSCCRPLRVCILHRVGDEKTQVVCDSWLWPFRSMKSDISHLGSIAIRSFMPLLRWFPCICYQLFLIVWFVRAGSDFPFTCAHGLWFVDQLTIRRSRWVKRLNDIWWISCCWYQRSCCSCVGGRDSSFRLWTPPFFCKQLLHSLAAVSQIDLSSRAGADSRQHNVVWNTEQRNNN